MTDKKVLSDYYTSKLALEILQKEVDEKKQAVVDLLRKDPEGKARIKNASFSLRTYTTYEYSDVIKKKVKDLKLIQKLEVESGVAKIKTESYSPVMKKIE